VSHFLTEQDIKKLKEEIEYRKVVTRKAMNEDVKEARAHGDLSENFEYKAAKRERGKNEGRIRYLEKMIKTSKIITDTTDSRQVGLGKRVVIHFLEDDFNEEYEIVTTIDTDAVNHKISIESPLGQAIYKKRLYEEVTISSPDGDYKIRIESIKNIEGH